MSTGDHCMISLAVWLSGPMFLTVGLCPGDFCRESPNQKSRWYASYWNDSLLWAFILVLPFGTLSIDLSFNRVHILYLFGARQLANKMRTDRLPRICASGDGYPCSISEAW